MTLTNEQLAELSELAQTAALAAGEIIADQKTKDLTVNHKPGIDSLAAQVVTEVDLKCQQAILTILTASCEQYDLALLSEEQPDDFSRLKQDYFWSIDPLDGTLAFVNAAPGYSVSIALVANDGSPQLGVIYDPVKQNLYHALRRHGAFKNQRRWTLDDDFSATDKPLTLIVDQSFRQHPYYQALIERLEQAAIDLGYQGLAIKNPGGAVMNACWVLENAPACYCKLPKPGNGGGSLWDYAASACLFNEIGAVVSDIHGQPLDLNRRDASFMNHRGVLYASDRVIADRLLEIYRNLFNSEH